MADEAIAAGHGAPPARTPELSELRTFCAAAELGSLGRAAIRLQVSQPALTKRLQALERLAGTRLLERSARGVKLTPAGRRLYEEARRLLDQATLVDEVLAGLRRSGGPVRLASSHSSWRAIGQHVIGRGDDAVPVELVTANSSVVRDLVADGRADIGLAATRPHRTPYPGVRELPLATDEIVCGAPFGHPWSRLGRITLKEFLGTPAVVRDPSSNARWTVDAVLRDRGLTMAPPLAEAGTPEAAQEEAIARNAPVLLSRHVIDPHRFGIVAVTGLSFPRAYVIILPAMGEPTSDVERLMDALRAQVAGWEPG